MDDNDVLQIPAWRRWVVQWDMSHNAIPLAFFAFTAMWQAASQHFFVFPVPAVIWYALYFTSCSILAVCIVLFLTRAIIFPSGIVSDFKHPRLMNFFFMPVMIGALSVLALPPWLRSVTIFRVGFYVLGSYQVALALYLFGEWLFGTHPTAFIHPLVFMQTIGFFLVANIGATAHLVDAAWAMLSIGSLFWLLVFITNFQHVALALDKRREKPQPTFFLFVAPPAQAALAFVVATLAAEGKQPTDTLLTVSNKAWPRAAESYVYIDLFLYLLMFRLFPTFWTSKFSISWWAYIFPLSAAASAAIWRCKFQQSTFWCVLATLFAAIASIAMVVVSGFTLWSLWTQKTPNNSSSLQAYAQLYLHRVQQGQAGTDVQDADDERTREMVSVSSAALRHEAVSSGQVSVALARDVERG